MNQFHTEKQLQNSHICN